MQAPSSPSAPRRARYGMDRAQIRCYGETDWQLWIERNGTLSRGKCQLRLEIEEPATVVSSPAMPRSPFHPLIRGAPPHCGSEFMSMGSTPSCTLRIRLPSLTLPLRARSPVESIYAKCSRRPGLRVLTSFPADAERRSAMLVRKRTGACGMPP